MLSPRTPPQHAHILSTPLVDCVSSNATWTPAAQTHSHARTYVTCFWGLYTRTHTRMHTSTDPPPSSRSAGMASLAFSLGEITEAPLYCPISIKYACLFIVGQPYCTIVLSTCTPHTQTRTHAHRSQPASNAPPSKAICLGRHTHPATHTHIHTHTHTHDSDFS
jgi:hypothetical protein